MATPTSVVIMAVNSWIGLYWRALIQMEVNTLTWEYFSICAPVVITFAPIGAFIASHLHRQVLAVLIYILETVALIGFLITGPPLNIIMIGGVIILVGVVFFYLLSVAGQKLSENLIVNESKIIEESFSNESIAA